jgi:oxygen-independent coproporphyrinogen III oxidase
LRQVKETAAGGRELAAMRLDLLARYGRPLPRYTSYPTAAQFTDGVGAGDFAAWLAAVPDGPPLSLYLHVPFCSSLCFYCGCHTTVAAKHDRIARYAETLRHELALVAAALGPRRRLGHVHFGGGSPNMLAPAEFRRLMAEIGRLFALEPGAEIALEIDPRGLTAAFAEAAAASGVNRASFGVQEFDPDVQAAIGRVQLVEQVAAAVARLKAAGIARVNFDLMYGLPRQTVDTLAATVAEAISLGPDRIALFGYAHVPWMKPHQALIDAATLPDAGERWRQYETAAAMLARHGFRPIGLDHFAEGGDALAEAAASGALRRNFQGYTTDRAPALVGVGASAISALPEGFAQNAQRLDEWRKAIESGRLATRRGRALTPDDRLRADVIGEIMCGLGCDLGAALRRHGAAADAFAAERAPLAAMARDGLVRLDGDRLTVPAEHRALVRAVASVFDRHLPPAGGRHAPAI